MSNIQIRNKAPNINPVRNKLHTESETITVKSLPDIKNMVQRGARVEYFLIGALLLLALLLRISFLPFESDDYQRYLVVWYNFIKANGGFLALKYNVGNYTPFYFYFIVLMSYIPLPQLVLFKVLSIFFDFMLAFGVYLIARLKYPRGYAPLIASVLVLFAPTVCINSALWAQCDSILASFAVAGLYFLLKRRPWLACFCFGLAFSFKPQGAFLFPLLLLLWMKQEISIKHLMMIPAAYLLMIFPAFLAGRPLTDLLTVYLAATSDVPYITLNAANFWEWFPNSQFSILHQSGLILALACALLLCLVVYMRHPKMSNRLLVMLAFIFALCVPFFLPQMHERYFYTADIMSVIYACYIPRQFYLAIGVQLASLFSYAPFLFGITVINLSLLAFITLGAMIVTISALIRELYFANCDAPQDITPRDF
ncbi:hypothetical protein KDH_48900 [Dictyobacter sp. S3.2.2.5]|uniref:Gpi18-like mannosyltransferase n=1 Tax=Dictyobacter halimunensis TaxID=3026934 RepID=A0ABQ6FZX7_9CHLR|nr:hypothetical protein KDH_48900 [Dictyobacter sp. S3.2.2.5]